MEQFYHYTESGLDNVFLANGVRYEETPRGRGVHIDDIEGLHLAIGRLLVREKKRLSGRELRFLRHELNLTQEHLAGILCVNVQAVARWEKGKNVPGPPDRLIRMLYEEETNGNKAIIEPLRRLAELDELIYGDEEERLLFEDTNEGWQPSEAA